MKIQDLTTKDVVHCDTEEKAIVFSKMMNHLGMTWGTGKKYTDKNYWEQYKKETCYCPKKSEFCSVKWYKSQNKNIVPFEQIETEEFPSEFFIPKNIFVPGVYWHFWGSNVELRYIDSQERMNALDGIFELIKECERPAPKFVKWVPSFKVPKEFWTKLGTKLEKFYGDSININDSGIKIVGGVNPGQKTHCFFSENIYVKE